VQTVLHLIHPIIFSSTTTDPLKCRLFNLYLPRQDIRRRICHRLANQHWVRWRGLGDTRRQARELISGPCLGAKARFLSLNRAQSRAVTGFLTGRNRLRRHLHLLGLLDSPLCRRCGAEEETSAHIVSVKLRLHSHMRIWAPPCSQRALRV